MKYILVTIDGTSSEEWRVTAKANSHCFDFYTQFGNKINKHLYRSRHLEGPNNVITGSDSSNIKGNSISFIQRSIRELFPSYSETKGLRTLSRSTISPSTTHITPYRNADEKRRAEIRTYYQERRRQISSHRYLRVVLVGHSRGGGIAIDVARYLKQLKIEVYFMGLFDAVDRSFDIDGGTVTNTKYKYHAKRGLAGSRPSFGNTGNLEEEFEKIFATSHGGVGGAPDRNPRSATADYSCSENITYADIESKRRLSPGMPVYVIKAIYNDELNKRARERWDSCKLQSELAYTWMRTKARDHGLPI